MTSSIHNHFKWGKTCERCGFEYGQHSGYGAYCPRTKGTGERFTTKRFTLQKQKKQRKGDRQ